MRARRGDFHADAGREIEPLLHAWVARRTVDSALTVISLASPPNGSGFYALIGARARSKLLQGAGARMLRGKVERAARDTAAMYLNWIRESLAV